MNGSILVVDDESCIREMLAEYLGKHGFQVWQAESAVKARELIGREPIDLAVLDITMPGEDGLSLARHIRENHTLAVIMLTAADSLVDRVVGLEMGADDYLAKPCDPRELVARIKSVLRRTKSSVKEPDPPSAAVPARVVRLGCCRLDLDSHRLLDENGRELPITNGEFDLLKVFATHPSRVLSRDQILDLTRNREWDPFDRSVDICVTRVRKKIEPDPERPRFIKTVRGAGYRFVPDGE
ncbi:response regulator [Methylocaldum sp.]|uniref:response regulator n=1 Tax=Methylocaldum sp. TaxID=1969727 RepID=UPI002D401161|nr:response regulator [Methylocaldum sp.]HYE38084.1 response regulator [Methylocaldum sp.]